MAFLTPQLLFQLKEIVRKHHTAFVANVFGHDAIPTAMLEDLKKLGLIDKGATSVEDAYLYGQVLATLEDPKVTNWTAQQVKAYVAKNPIPLTPVERAAQKTATLTAASYAVGLGNVIEKETGQLLIEADHDLRQKLQQDVKDATALNLDSRKTVSELKSNLGHRTQDWTRNLDRIAVTEKHNAMDQGVIDNYKQRFGDEALVAKRAAPDACPICLKLHNGPDGNPRVFKLSELGPPGANVGKKQSAWVSCIGAIHPNCSCSTIRVPNGWGFDGDGKLVPQKKKSATIEKSHALQARLEFQGLLIAIEQQAGDLRNWQDRHGDSGVTVMRHPYGFIEGTTGADGEALDCFVGPNADAKDVYVVNQRKKQKDGSYAGFDEQKILLGFTSIDDAREAYLAHYDDPRILGSILTIPLETFKAKVSPAPAPVLLKSERLTIPLDLDKAFPHVLTETAFGDWLEKANPSGQQRAGHKYTTRIWSVDRWLYKYAEDNKGHLAGHASNPEHFALKLPAADKHKLEAFKAVHGLPGEVTVSGEHATLPMTVSSARTAWKNTVQDAPSVKPEPVAAAAPVKPEAPKAPAERPKQPELSFTVPAPKAPEPVDVPLPAPAKEAAAIKEATQIIESDPVVPTRNPALAADPMVENDGSIAASVERKSSKEIAEKLRDVESKQRDWAYGRHIWGSAKDKRDAMALIQEGRIGDLSHEAAATLISRASLMPAYDSAEAQKRGVSPGAAHMIQTLTALVAPKPADTAPATLDAYARGIRLLTGSLQHAKTRSDVEDVLKDLRRQVSVGTFISEHIDRAAADKAALAAGPLAKVSGVWERGERTYKVEIKDPAQAEAILALGQRFATQTGLGSFTRGHFYAAGPYGPSFGASPYGKVFQDAVNLASQADAKGDAGWAHVGAQKAAESVARSGKTKETRIPPWKREVPTTPEVGATTVKVERGDRDRFGSTFGIAVQRGESISDKDLDHHLKHAEMAFADMAKVLGIDPKQVSFNGRLGVAFGARGHGGALAHYETSTKAINLARNAGAGSLAHEWGHFLDNVLHETLSPTKDPKRPFVSEGQRGLDPDFATAIKGVMTAISDHPDKEAAKAAWTEKKNASNAKLEQSKAAVNGLTGEARSKAIDAHNALVREHNAHVQTSWGTSDFKRDARERDAGKAKGYWSSEREMWARAFESYIQDKMTAAGGHNSYLVSGSKGGPGQPYPEGEERKRINAAFDKFFNVVRSKGLLNKAMQHLDDLQKGANHKYIMRMPTGGVPKYRYVYKADKVDAFGAHAPEVGAKVKLHHDGQAGHYEVKRNFKDGRVEMVHDETGDRRVIHKDHLQDLFHAQHGTESESTARQKMEAKHEKEDRLPKARHHILAAIANESGIEDHDFAKQEEKYKAWVQNGRKGPKPKRDKGGHLDAFEADKKKGKHFGSLTEAFTDQVKGARTWREIKPALEQLRTVPGWENARFPQDVMDRHTMQDMERKEGPNVSPHPEHYGQAVPDSVDEHGFDWKTGHTHPVFESAGERLNRQKREKKQPAPAAAQPPVKRPASAPQQQEESTFADDFPGWSDPVPPPGQKPEWGGDSPALNKSEPRLDSATGSGHNLQNEGPPRPVNDPDTTNTREVLTDPGNMRSDVLITRDPAIYLGDGEQERMSRTYPIDLETGTWPVAADQELDVENNRQVLERTAQQVLDVERNKADPTYVGPAQREGVQVMPNPEADDAGES